MNCFCLITVQLPLHLVCGQYLDLVFRKSVVVNGYVVVDKARIIVTICPVYIRAKQISFVPKSAFSAIVAVANKVSSK